MSNPGSPNEETVSPRTRRLSRLTLAVLAVVLVAALALGIQLFSVLFGIVFPPDAPLPADMTQQAHENLAYGVDEYVYTSSQDPCEVIAFYQDADGECVVAPGICAGTRFVTPGLSTERLATCTGRVDFSIFNMQWEAVVSSVPGDGDTTRLDLLREVFWIGSAPERPLE